MQKAANSLGRILVMVGFALSCFGLLLFLWLAFGGPTPLKPKGYRVHMSFAEATQLATEADVRISGVPVGKVKTIKTDRQTGRSDAVIEVKPEYAPLAADVKAILRQKTLLGETYVELTPGSAAAPKIPENGSLAQSRVSPTVELDENFRALDPERRRKLQGWLQTLAQGVNHRGQDISDTIGSLAPFAEDTQKLLAILNSQSAAVRRLVRNTGTVFDALSERDGQLTSLITNSNRVFSTTAARDRELADTFTVLPTFEREATRTVRRLTTFSDATNPLITQLRPAAKELSPTLTDLSALAPDLKALFRDLNPLISASKTGLPALQAFLERLRPFLGELDAPLRQINPILDFAGRYKPELGSFFANTVAATQAVTPGRQGGTPVHYLRTTNPINAENLAVYPVRVGTNRPNPYHLPGSFKNLASGLSVFEDRHCRNGLPAALDPVSALLPEALRENILKFAFSNGTAVAPACKKQGKFEFQGRTTDFPQVGASGGATARKRHK
jgi:virulence factor Mce-like protein